MLSRARPVATGRPCPGASGAPVRGTAFLAQRRLKPGTPGCPQRESCKLCAVRARWARHRVLPTGRGPAPDRSGSCPRSGQSVRTFEAPRIAYRSPEGGAPDNHAIWRGAQCAVSNHQGARCEPGAIGGLLAIRKRAHNTAGRPPTCARHHASALPLGWTRWKMTPTATAAAARRIIIDVPASLLMSSLESPARTPEADQPAQPRRQE